ncbi:hypothetical protein H0H92_004917 [Tricholoma furcatifolium]|nr:hypothetical protein H0H92_004917 [Tricholoma furcatifolium]
MFIRMAKLSFLSFFLLFLPLLACTARLPDGRPHANVLHPPGIPLVPLENFGALVISRNGTELPPYNKTYWFDQLIDHTNPSLGTFKQRYWHTYEFYEPGYSGYLTNQTINGLIAQQQNGSTIVLEHRFYGLSNPYPDLTVKSFRVHTIQQAIEDLAYFANNVVLPMPGGNQVTPDKAPWILIGGSYSGALTSWTMVDKPGLFWAGYASSAVVQAILDFWEYFEPIRLNMPANCSADVQAVIDYVDKTFTSKNTAAIQQFKQSFGLANLTHLDDVAGALRNNLWDWQALQPTTGPGGQFFKFCDALEVKNGISASAGGWGLDHALTAWGSYFKNSYYQTLCGTVDAQTCLGTYDSTATYYTNTSIDNSNRSWFWIVCNEVGFLQEAAPRGYPTLVSRLIQPPYDLRQCQLMFPDAFHSTPPSPAIQTTNEDYEGWNVNLDRIFFANGQRDPWKDATVSATRHTVKSTSQQPIYIGDGYHCSDLKAAAGKVDATVNAVQVAALGYFKTWLAEWKPNPSAYTAPNTVAVSAGISADVPTYDGPSKPVNAFFRPVGP